MDSSLARGSLQASAAVSKLQLGSRMTHGACHAGSGQSQCSAQPDLWIACVRSTAAFAQMSAHTSGSTPWWLSGASVRNAQAPLFS